MVEWRCRRVGWSPRALVGVVAMADFDFDAWLVASCQRQGVPLQVDDSDTLERVAVLFAE